MDKEKATLTLTKMLCNLGYVNLVVDPAVKSYLLDNAKSVVFDSGKGAVSVIPLESLYVPHFAKTPVHQHAVLLEVKKVFPEANYLFADKGKKSGLSYLENVLVTPVALIGEMEEKVLRENFYKDVPEEIINSFEALGIMHFIKEYEGYKNTDNFSGVLEVLKSSKKLTDKLTDFISKAGFDGEGEISRSKLESAIGGIDLLNNHFVGLGIKVSINTHDHRRSSFKDYIHKKNLLQVVDEVNKKLGESCQISEKFYNFVFSLPYEEQNIKANMNILRHHSKDWDYVSVMVNEYSHGKCFQEYFDVLDQGSQHVVVAALKSITDQNLIHNSFLWSKGFRDIGLDHLALYENDAETFIKYFSNRSMEEKEVILRDIMDCDFINDVVVEWLNENEADLIRKVGFNG